MPLRPLLRRGSGIQRVLLLVCVLALALVASGDAGAGPEAHAAVPDPAARLVLPALVREGYPGTSPYTVQPGDTLFSIARRFGTTVDVVTALNGIDDPSKIRAGDYLYIPDRQVPTGPSRLVTNGSRGSGLVALTFDMGGRVDPALDIMQWLIDHEVHATIFMTGAMAENQNTDAGRQVIALVDSHRDLFELGNHSYSHPDFTTISDAEMQAELLRTEKAVARYSSLPMPPRFRPPFGAVNAHVLEVVGAAGYGQTLMWDVDTIDWRPVSDGGPTAPQIVSKVVTNAQGGSIVLMHLGGYNTLDALPGIVDGLRARGFGFARISDLPLP